jgi:hypothetical protein
MIVKASRRSKTPELNAFLFHACFSVFKCVLLVIWCVFERVLCVFLNTQVEASPGSYHYLLLIQARGAAGHAPKHNIFEIPNACKVHDGE